MRLLTRNEIIPSLLAVVLFFSCKKEPSGINSAPIANAGADTNIVLPIDSVMLDGSASTDPNGIIASFAWAKIAGPVSCTIINANSAKTLVTTLTAGVYHFELTVKDNNGQLAKDTVQVTVNASVPVQCPSNRPELNAQLVPVGALSLARSAMAVASAGTKILFAGPGTRVDIFDFVANTWSTAELSSPRNWIGAVGALNKVFFAGGQDDDGYSVKAVDIYDVSTNTWSVSHLSRPADGLAAVTVGNKVFFAGGNWGLYAVSTVDIYNLTTNTWSIASLSVSRNFITPVAINNKVYFSGGDPWTGQTSDVIDIYDNSTNSWSTSILQVPRGYHTAIGVNDVIYFAGGKSSYSSPSNCSVETWNVNTGARSLMNLFGPGHWSNYEGQSAVTKDNKIIFLRHNDADDTNKFDIYNIQNNTWSVGIMPIKIIGASVISVNNTIYVAGGKVNGALSDKVYRLEF